MVHFSLKNLTAGDNNFDDFLENQLTAQNDATAPRTGPVVSTTD